MGAPSATQPISFIGRGTQTAAARRLHDDLLTRLYGDLGHLVRQPLHGAIGFLECEEPGRAFGAAIQTPGVMLEAFTDATKGAFGERLQNTPDAATAPDPHPQAITVRIKDACRMTGIGRSKLYELIASGDIRVVKIGAMTLIPVESIRELIEAHAA